MRPLDVPAGLEGMADAFRKPMANNLWPLPGNVAAVLRYAAKIIRAGNALYLSTANEQVRRDSAAPGETHGH
jgi:hypothetical protein